MLKIKKHFQQTQIILKHGKEVLIENKDIAVKKAIDYGLVCLFQYLMTQSYDFLLCDNTCYNLFIIRGGSGGLKLPNKIISTNIEIKKIFCELASVKHACNFVFLDRTH